MLAQSISRNAVLLALFAVISTLVISGTFFAVKDTISDNIRQQEERALIDIVPLSRHNNSMLDDVQMVENSALLGLRKPKKMYIARQDATPVAVIIPATARDGYTGDIDLIVGINMDGTIAGVRVLSHRETPGLGDAVDRNKSLWVDSFNNKSLTNPDIDKWKVKKDNGVFDQFTGATITPRAVTKAVLQTLQYFEQNRYSIIGQQPPGNQTTVLPEQTNVTQSKH